MKSQHNPDSSSQALRPNLLSQYRNFKPKEKDEEETVSDEKHIAGIADTHGWRAIEDYIHSLQVLLDTVVVDGMQAGQTLDMIGQNTVVTQICKEYLQRVINKVNDSRQK